ncbi:M1 family metallopeptidase [Streptomyces sp. SLBN-31]|uniref:M1 family metallopeptidase n=1 Tax=Streptomyces sp. SLBN-31 TaxID=2768444 RepID=UPI0011519079|nr:M1 family metallopeptidase [Streptomyces sp. SLBN-31]TQJ92649.1 peptidase M1-like protein [Streptomyces sp. SLBN-31]
MHSARLSRAALFTVLLLTTGTACTGSVGRTAGAAGPGASSAGDALFPTLGNRGYDVAHYALTLDYVPETNALVGTAVITARAKQALSRFSLDLMGLEVRDARVDGSEAEVRRVRNKLILTPADPLRSGKVFTTTVRYSGIPKMITDADGGVEGWIETDDGAAALGEPTGSMAWFPGNHHPSDKALYDITITVPKDYTAVSNGELAGLQHKGRRTTSHWHTGEPMASYLASVVVGSFDISTTTTTHGLPVYIAIDPDEVEGSPDMAELVPKIIDWASGRFGRYPFSGTGAIVDHLPDIEYALETQSKPYFEEAPDETLVVHELAHQWFGNSVTPTSWRDMWLNEGFATYAEWLWKEDQGATTADEIFDAFYHGTHPESKGIWDFPPAQPPSADRVSDPPVYGRGAMTLHRLRLTVGDKCFFTILRAWSTRHQYGNANTRQFIELCEKESGMDLAELFEAWLYSRNKPTAA